MAFLYNIPPVFGLLSAFAGFVVDDLFSALYQCSCVFKSAKNCINSRIRPSRPRCRVLFVVAVIILTAHLLFMYARRRDVFVIQVLCYTYITHSVNVHIKYPLYNRRRNLINNKMIFVIGVNQVTVGCERAYKLAVSTF